jgi:HEAT repeat protein
MPTSKEFEALLDHLRDAEHAFPATGLYQLSDLSKNNLASLEAIWPELPVERRRSVMHDLNELSESNFEVTFESVFRLGLEDEDPEVRATAINSLWEVEAPNLIAPFIDFLQHDPDATVRAAAAGALGRFVYLGEVDELPTPQARRVENVLLGVIQGNDDLNVRRRALEAVAYSSRPEVAPLISAAYASPEEKMRVSALFAMGRTADPAWSAQVRAELENVLPEIRFEAARAAGELELKEAVPALAQLVEDVDPQVREAAIWSLSQVGGPEAERLLTDLLNQADDDEQDFILEALDNLDFTDDLYAFSAFEFEEDSDEEDDEDEPA